MMCYGFALQLQIKQRLHKIIEQKTEASASQVEIPFEFGHKQEKEHKAETTDAKEREEKRQETDIVEEETKVSQWDNNNY